MMSMPTRDAEEERRHQRERARANDRQKQRDAEIRRDVETLEATVQGMWDILDKGGERRERERNGRSDD